MILWGQIRIWQFGHYIFSSLSSFSRIRGLFWSSTKAHVHLPKPPVRTFNPLLLLHFGLSEGFLIEVQIYHCSTDVNRAKAVNWKLKTHLRNESWISFSPNNKTIPPKPTFSHHWSHPQNKKNNDIWQFAILQKRVKRRFSFLWSNSLCPVPGLNTTILIFFFWRWCRSRVTLLKNCWNTSPSKSPYLLSSVPSSRSNRKSLCTSPFSPDLSSL